MHMICKALLHCSLTRLQVTTISVIRNLSAQLHHVHKHRYLLSKEATLLAKNSALCQLSSTCCAGKLRPTDIRVFSVMHMSHLTPLHLMHVCAPCCMHAAHTSIIAVLTSGSLRQEASKAGGSISNAGVWHVHMMLCDMPTQSLPACASKTQMHAISCALHTATPKSSLLLTSNICSRLLDATLP